MDFLEPKEITLNHSGKEYTYKISKFPFSAGREIMLQYPLSAFSGSAKDAMMGFLMGDYSRNEAIMYKLMWYVARVLEDGREIPLTAKSLCDNHVPNWELGLELEWEMIKYNCSFFQSGSIQSFLQTAIQRIKDTATEILTHSLQSSLNTAEQAFKS